MRLAFGLVSRLPGGAEWQTVLLADALRDRGHDVRLYCLEPEASEAMLSQVTPLPTRVCNTRRMSCRVAEWAVWLRRDRIDAAIGMLSGPHMVLSMACLGSGVSLYGRRSAVWDQCVAYGGYRKVVPHLQQFARRWGWRTTALIANSEAVCESARRTEGWPERQIVQIDNGWPDYPPAPLRDITPWYCARPRPEKGVPEATQGFARLGMPLAVTFDAPPWPAVGMYAHLSLAEASSNAIGMALSHSIPTVAFDLPGARGLLGPDFVRPLGDYAGMVDVLRRWREASRRARQAIGEAQREHLGPTHQLSVVASRWDSLLSHRWGGDAPCQNTP